jgi:hypothetical protein
MTTYTVGLKLQTRTKVLTIEAEDALWQPSRSSLRTPRHTSRTFASRIDVVIGATHMKRCRIRKWPRQYRGRNRRRERLQINALQVVRSIFLSFANVNMSRERGRSSLRATG